jgi:hypothetical protein
MPAIVRRFPDSVNVIDNTFAPPQMKGERSPDGKI